MAILALAIPAVASASDPYADLLAPESACPGQDGCRRFRRPRRADHDLPAPLGPATASTSRACTSRSSSAPHPARKARDIRRCRQFSHYACGRNAFYWEQRVGFFRGTYGAGENLALTYGADTTPRGTMDLWLNSAEHRSNLLRRRATGTSEWRWSPARSTAIAARTSGSPSSATTTSAPRHRPPCSAPGPARVPPAGSARRPGTGRPAAGRSWPRAARRSRPPANPLRRSSEARSG